MARYTAAATVRATKRLNDPYRNAVGTQYGNLLANTLAILNRIQNTIVARCEAVFEDAAQAGKIKLSLNAEALPLQFRVNGAVLEKAATDNFWNLSAQTDTPALEYAAFYLLIDASGAASIQRASANAASAAAARAVLLADGLPPADKAVVGVFVAGPETDFSMDAIVAVSGAEVSYGFPADMINVITAAPVTSD